MSGPTVPEPGGSCRHGSAPNDCCVLPRGLASFSMHGRSFMRTFQRFSLRILLISLWLGQPAAAAIVFYQNLGTAQKRETGRGTTLAITSSAAVSAGTQVLISFAMDSATGTVSAVDSGGNTYVVDADITNTGSVRSVILRSSLTSALSVGSTITITHPSVVARAATASAFNGLATTSPLDVTARSTGNGKTVNSGTTATTTEFNELLFGAFGVEAPTTDTFAAGTGFTALTGVGSTGSPPASNISAHAEYRIVSTTGAYAANGTLSAKDNWAAAIATYKMAPPTVQWSAATTSLSESGGAAVLTATLSATTRKTVTVNYATVDGTAKAGSDYLATSGTLTFAPGVVSGNVSVSLQDDLAVEGSESLTVNMSSPTHATLGSPSSAGLTILDNDPTLIGFSSAAYTAGEAAGTALITVSLDAPSGFTVSVNYATTAGTATAGSDFTSASGTLTFSPGQTSRTFSVPILNDQVREGDETVHLALSSPVNGNLGTTSSATLTITDNDPVPTVSFSHAVTYTAEDAASVTITAGLSNPTVLTVGVNYATSDGTAAAGSDYLSASGTLTFTPGQTSQTFTVPILEDNTDENDETVHLTLSNAVNANLGSGSTALINITDNNGVPTVSFAGDAFSVTENAGTASISVHLSNPAAYTVTVNYATSNGTAVSGQDYTAAGGTLTFAAGQTVQTISVPILNDTLDEGDETINLTLSGASTSLGAPGTALLTVVDDDALPGVGFSSSTYSGGEAGGSVSITVSLSTASGRTVTVGYQSADDTATAGADYTAVSGTLTFSPGQTSQTFSVPVLNDSLDENDETVLLSLANPDKATLGISSATLTLQDDDAAPGVAFSAAAFSEGEADGLAGITVNLSAASGRQVSVQYATTSSGTATEGADYSATSGTLTFTAGQTSQTFWVPIADDNIDEPDETVGLSLSAPVNAGLGTPAAATLTITDDDDPPLVSFTAAEYSATESAGLATVTVTLSNPSSQTVSVDYATANGTAQAGSDYTSASGTLSFAAGQTSRTFSVPITADDIYESDETVSLALSNAVNATLGVAAATLTIQNDDVLPVVSFQSSLTTAAESAGSVNITVVLDHASADTVTVAYATSGGTAKSPQDYANTSGTLTFTPGQTSQTFSVTINTDNSDEQDETVNLTLSGPTNATLGASSAQLAIIDDDGTPSVNFVAGQNALENAGTAAVQVVLSNTSGGTITVHYATSDGTAAAGSDYTAASGTLTFNAGESTKTFNLTMAPDSLYELDETVQMTLSLVSGTVDLGALSGTTFTIRNDDAAPTAGFTSTAAGVGETAGSAGFTVSLNTASAVATTVHYATADVTATAGADYTLTNGTLTIAAGSLSGNISVPILNDTLVEGSETLQLTLSALTNATLAAGASSAVLTVADNDVELGVSVSDGQTSATAGNPITYTAVVSNNGVTPAAGASVSGTLPAEVSGGAWTCAASAGSSCAASGTGNLADSVSLAAGGKATYTVTGTLTSGARGAVSFGVTVGAPAGWEEASAADNSATDVTDVLAPPPVVSLSSATASAAETAGNVVFTVSLSAAAAGAVTVGYTTADITATAGSDYTAASGTLTFPPGTTSATFNVPVLDDSQVEGSETLRVTLSSPTNATLGTGISSAVLTITDNDADLSIRVSDGKLSATAGDPIAYTVVVANHGVATVSGAAVSGTLPSAVSGATWSCSASSGSGCAASGAGSLADTVSLAAGGTATYLVNGTLKLTALGAVSFTVSVGVPSGLAESTTADNTATDVTDVQAPPPTSKSIYLPLVRKAVP